MHTLRVLLLATATCSQALAEVKTEVVEYSHGDAVLEGVLAWDDANADKRPGVLVVPAWKGVDDHSCETAKKLAAEGYVALVADMYGKGVRPKTGEEARAESGKYRDDRALMRARAAAGLECLSKQALVDTERLAVIGFCFGGTVALELARSGAALDGAVSIHGGLGTPNPADAKAIQGRVLALHGAADPHVPPAEVEAFQKEMKDAGVDWKLIPYEGAVHAFTDPSAGSDPSRGAAYHEEAAKQAWADMTAFLHDVLSAK